MKKNEFATTYVETSLLNMVKDKIVNMTGNEISEKLAKFISGHETEIAKIAYSLIDNDEIINSDTKIRASSDFDVDALTKDCEEDKPEELLYDALYNYDALWMTAIQRYFPDNTTNTQCGWGMIRFVSAPERTFSSVEEAKEWGSNNLGAHSFVKVRINNETKSEIIFLCGTDKAYEEQIWSDIYEVIKKHLEYFDMDIDDDDDSSLVDKTSEIRDTVIGWIEMSTGTQLVNAIDEY